MRPAAIISPDGLYRYHLHRQLAGDLIEPRHAVYVMLNPSTADEHDDDPTTARCINRAIAWGCTDLHLLNLYAYRASKPKVLEQRATEGTNIVGPDTDVWIGSTLHALRGTDPIVVAAWGAWSPRGIHHDLHERRIDQVRTLLAENGVDTLWCLGTTAAGQPRHPLFVRRTVELEPWPTPTRESPHP